MNSPTHLLTSLQWSHQYEVTEVTRENIDRLGRLFYLSLCGVILFTEDKAKGGFTDKRMMQKNFGAGS